jgi:hypothetical protein
MFDAIRDSRRILDRLLHAGAGAHVHRWMWGQLERTAMLRQTRATLALGDGALAHRRSLATAHMRAGRALSASSAGPTTAVQATAIACPCPLLIGEHCLSPIAVVEPFRTRSCYAPASAPATGTGPPTPRKTTMARLSRTMSS